MLVVGSNLDLHNRSQRIVASALDLTIRHRRPAILGLDVKAQRVESGFRLYRDFSDAGPLGQDDERRTRITVASATWPLADEIVDSTIAP